MFIDKKISLAKNRNQTRCDNLNCYFCEKSRNNSEEARLSQETEASLRASTTKMKLRQEERRERPLWTSLEEFEKGCGCVDWRYHAIHAWYFASLAWNCLVESQEFHRF
ncbi:MAG: hypothetical protein ACP5E2_16200 [Terracidiphilus sp.]